MEKKNFHTHTLFCDGKNTAEEMVLSALDKGFTALGFSGHSFTEFDKSYCMSQEDTLRYIECVKSLKERYRDRIRIYLGLEADYYSENIDCDAYDFIIGSVHYIRVGDVYLPVDSSGECQREAVEKYFGGSFDAYCEAYYSLVADVAAKTKADFVGHIDLVTKFNEDDCLFPTDTVRYTSAWRSAVDTLIPYNIPFEINTGAIARKKRITPYPSIEIAEYITEKGGSLIYSSDCHNAEQLDCGFEYCTERYKSCNLIGFESLIKA